MATNNTGIQNYLNTLIFCIVAKAVTIIMLGILFTEGGKRFIWLILTVEGALIAIIITALVYIVEYEKNKSKEMDNFLKSKAIIKTCPDYFVRAVDKDENTICENSYTTPDNKYKYSFPDVPTFKLQDVFPSGITNSEACLRVADNAKTPNFNNASWTDLKGKCSTFVTM